MNGKLTCGSGSLEHHISKLDDEPRLSLLLCDQTVDRHTEARVGRVPETTDDVETNLELIEIR